MDTTTTTSTLSGTTATRLVGTIAHGGAAPSSTRAIEPRMNGPRRRANGGFAAGTFADLVGGTATVALRRMVPLDFKPWESFRELRAQGVTCIDDVVKTRGAKALADYIEAVAADPMQWRRAAPPPVAPPAIKQSSPKFKCRRCDADRSAADLRCPRCNGQETYHG